MTMFLAQCPCGASYSNTLYEMIELWNTLHIESEHPPGVRPVIIIDECEGDNADNSMVE